MPDDTAIDTRLGAAAGLVVGLKAGSKKASKILSPFKLVFEAGKPNSDTFIKNKSEFVRQIIERNIETVKTSCTDSKQQIKEFQKLSKDAAIEFENLTKGGIDTIIKMANKTKAKYIVGCTLLSTLAVSAIKIVADKITAKLKK